MVHLAAHLAFAAVLWSAPAMGSEWTPAKNAPLGGAADVEHTSWSLAREPGGPFDRIEVHRYRAKAATVATLLYLPGTNMNGEAALETEENNSS